MCLEWIRVPIRTWQNDATHTRSGSTTLQNELVYADFVATGSGLGEPNQFGSMRFRILREFCQCGSRSETHGQAYLDQYGTLGNFGRANPVFCFLLFRVYADFTHIASAHVLNKCFFCAIRMISSSVADPGYLSRNPDPICFHPGSEFFYPGSASKNFSILTQKNGF
jgi:hypothetical protein